MANIQAERTLSSETVYSGSLISVRRDEVRLPDGRTTAREIVVHPDVVAMVPILPDNRIVFVRQYRKAVDRVLLEVPAGGIDPGETPEDAVRREMKEETGYGVGQMRRLAGFYTSPGFTTEFMYLYEVFDLAPGTATEENDELEVVTLNMDEAWSRVRAGEIADAKTLLALQFAGNLG